MMIKTLMRTLVLCALTVSAASAGPIRDLISGQNSSSERSSGEKDGPLRSLFRKDDRSNDISSYVKKITITHDGKQRYYLLYVPEKLKNRRDNSVLLVFHGGYGEAEKMLHIKDLIALAERDGFIISYPDALEKHWNDMRKSEKTDHIDDVGFIRQVVSHLVSTQSINPQRVFAAGISNGGGMSSRLACEAGSLLSGIAVISSLMPKEQIPICRPSRPIPVVMFQGTDDKLALFDGGKSSVHKFTVIDDDTLGGASFYENRDFWLAKNGCSNNPISKTMNRLDDNTSVTELTYPTCSNGIQNRFFVIDGGGHNWPGVQSKSTKFSQYITDEIQASEEIVKFFKPYGL